MNLLIYILICWGISNIVCNEYIFSSIKERIKNSFISKLVSCTTCFGFWCGVLLYFLILPFSFTTLPVFINAILGGFIISGVNNIIEHLKIRLFH